MNRSVLSVFTVVWWFQMERKIFWMLFIVLGLVMDFTLPIWWSVALTLPLLVGCWWVAYKSEWFG
jgi:hypothetical protein